MIRTLSLVVLMSTTLALSTTAQADRAGTTAVKVQSSMSVSEIRQYVEDVDRRFQKGRYDVSSKRDQEWMIQIIAALRQELDAADSSSAPSRSCVSWPANSKPASSASKRVASSAGRSARSVPV